MNKEVIMCNGCGKEIKDEIDLWDKDKKLCDKCSMKRNAAPQTINNLNLSYIN